MEKKSPPAISVHPHARLAAIADQCVKCGQCLETCPTYRLHGHEAQSPRGRLELMARSAAIESAADSSVDAAIGACVSCGNCERACPLHLPIVSAIDDWRTKRPLARTWPARLLRHPRLLALALRALRAMPRALVARLPASERLLVVRSRSSWRGDDGPGTHDVGILPGCTGRTLDGQTLAALVRLVRHAGRNATVLATTCCGNLDRHAGRTTPDPGHAASPMRDLQALLHLNTGCDSGWRRLFPGQSIEDAVAWLSRQPVPAYRAHPGPIAVFAPCTAGRTHRDSLRRLLDRVPGLRWRWLDAPTGCCGAAGEHAMTHPREAEAMRDAWLGAWLAGREPIVLAANLGCALHVGAAPGFSATILHPLEFLARQLDPADEPLPNDQPT